MATKNLQRSVQKILDFADVKISGERPWDIQIKNPHFYSRVLAGGSLALGESYMDGWWECKAVDQLIGRLLKAKLDAKIRNSGQLIWGIIVAVIINQQGMSGAQVVGRRHYDIGNNLYRNMLDKRMNYSCGYWKNASTLDEAQEAKLDLICKKLKLNSGMVVLDIGCGFCGFAKFAAEKYQVKVVGVTISKEQAKLAQELCRGLGVEIKLQDYRNIEGKFDRIVSVGMIEHVGYKNYRTFFKVAGRCLKKNGLFLLHTIGGIKSVIRTDPWIGKYIFPNSMLPSQRQLTKAWEGVFKLEDWHNFGPDYAKTLMAWHANFSRNWDKIKNDYDERFHRMWNYYLLSCAGSFRVRRNQLWQIVLSKTDSAIGYESIR